MEDFWISLKIKPVVLWSDAFVYALALAIAIWFVMSLRRAYWIQAFKQLATSRLAMVSLGIMLTYACAGFLDTLHFKPYDEKNKNFGRTISVLDGLGREFTESHAEKTYSEPFATHSFVKETELKADGSQGRVSRELRFGGQHLKVDGKLPEGDALTSAKHSDILMKTLKGIGYGIGIGLLCTLLTAAAVAVIKKWIPIEDQTGWIQGIGIFATSMGTLISVAFVLSQGYHIFGTDQSGADVFWAAIKGTRTGLVIGSLTTLIVTPFAILFGVLAGYRGGILDDIITYVYSTLDSIPSILLIAAAMLIIQGWFGDDESLVAADKRLLCLCVIMGITSWTGLCRLLRAETLKLRQSEFVQAADAFGIGHWTIMFRHLVPNVVHLVIINVALRFSGLVLAEAMLAYIGIGVDPSMASWGGMINSARPELARDPIIWWNLGAAFIFMLGVVLPANLFGDAVRDALDPKLRTV